MTPRREWWIWQHMDCREVYAVESDATTGRVLRAYGTLPASCIGRPWESVQVDLPRLQDGHGRRQPGPCRKAPLSTVLCGHIAITGTLERRRPEFHVYPLDSRP